IAARVESGAPLLFEVSDVTVDPEAAVVRFAHDGAEQVLECDVVAGCGGFHGVCRPSIPGGVLRAFGREDPVGWRRLPAQVAPSMDELVYAHTSEGFALLSLRSPELSRYYVQVSHDEDVAEWPDDRVWEALHRRTELAGWTLHEGPVLEKGVTGMRSHVT